MQRLLIIVLCISSSCLFADVQVATVTVREQSTLVREILARVVASRRQIAASEISGVVTSARLEMGTRVSRGQVIVELDTGEQAAVLLIARRELERAEVELRHQSRSLDRARLNRDQRVLSEARFDEFQTAHARAQIERALMQNRLDLQKTRLAKYQIRSSIDGALVKSTPVPGHYVRSGDPLFEVVDGQDLRIRLTLTSAELAGLARGDYALYCRQRLLDTLAIAPASDAGGMTSLELLGCDAAHADTGAQSDSRRLRAGDAIAVQLVRELYADIPKRGIQKDTAGEFVYVVARGIVVRRQLAELKPGELVIVLGSEQIVAGDAVSSIRLDVDS